MSQHESGNSSSSPGPAHESLRREVGVFGATLMGLGSIVGTGIFVSIGIAAGAAGPAVLLAIAIAAVVAVCNGLSSAQLAANHPVSGGTYEYGYRWLHPSLGFTAGWMFLCAKTASAATAALGFAGYLLNALGSNVANGSVPVAVGIVVLLAALILTGIRRSNAANIVIVSATLVSLLVFLGAGVVHALRTGTGNLTPFFAPVSQDVSPIAGLLEACALMFVAYTGYGRIATLGEEIRNPRRNIPAAISVTLLVSMALYLSVGWVAIAILGPEALAEATEQKAAPLEIAARQLSLPLVTAVISVGAMTAMLGVLLNLILGLSRVALAMGRRGDLPRIFSKLDPTGSTPAPAVALVSVLIIGLVLIGNVKTTWSFSAFTVLVYYAVTNLAAIALTKDERLYPRFVPWVGLVSCLFLAFWVEPKIWLVGLAIIAGGLVWHGLARMRAQDRA